MVTVAILITPYSGDVGSRFRQFSLETMTVLFLSGLYSFVGSVPLVHIIRGGRPLAFAGHGGDTRTFHLYLDRFESLGSLDGGALSPLGKHHPFDSHLRGFPYTLAGAVSGISVEPVGKSFG